jgi:secreted protein with Ig-like and vWFA domain
MRTTLLIGILTVVTGMTAFGANDNTLGTWKLNTAKSKLTANPSPLKNSTMVREASDGGVKVTVKGERVDGTQVDSTYTAKYDGSETKITQTGLQYDTIWIKQINANTLTDERKKAGGAYHATGRTVVSLGGKVMTVTMKGTNTEGKTFTTVLVFDKQ